MRRIKLSALIGLLFAVYFSASLTHAQTIKEVSDARQSCTTIDVVGISAQLAEFQMDCLRPGAFVRVDDHARISTESSRVHAFMQASARTAVHAAADMGFDIRITSAFRTIADQYVLRESLGHSGGCGAAAVPGSSRHQSGRAIDVTNNATLRAPLTAAGCRGLAGDPVHFDCPGEDLGSDSVLAFQTLWNVNHPEDIITEDGLYGPNTERRLERTPADGFATAGCGDCIAGCEGNVAVATDCGRTPCGETATCSFSGAGAGAGAGETASCEPNAMDVCSGGAERVCTDLSHFVLCTGGVSGAEMACDSGRRCQDGVCLPPVMNSDAGIIDGGMGGMDAMNGLDGGMDAAMTADIGTRPADPGGCGCTVGSQAMPSTWPAYFGLFGWLGLAIWRGRVRS